MLKVKLRDVKHEFKEELKDKLRLIKDMERIKNERKAFQNEAERLKIQVAEINDNFLNVREQLNEEANRNDAVQHEFERNKSNVDKLKELREKMNELLDKYEQLQQENAELASELSRNKYNAVDYQQFTDKYEAEIFALNCELNLIKFALIEIAVYKTDTLTFDRLEKALEFNEKYKKNAPYELKTTVERIISEVKDGIYENSIAEYGDEFKLKDKVKALTNSVAFFRSKSEQESRLRRRIHNRYMQLRGNLRVMCRIRPFLGSEGPAMKREFIDTFVVSNDTVAFNLLDRNKSYELDYVFNQESSQDEVFDECALLIESMLNGNDVCILAYGQTCTGKTYSIQGEGGALGIVMMAADYVFRLINDSGYTSEINESSVTLSVAEVYNETVYDLLNEDTPAVGLLEQGDKVETPDLSEVLVACGQEACKLIRLAAKFRIINSTNYNKRSSRSHAIYCLKLQFRNVEGKTVRATLKVIDLAGSERISKSEETKEEVRREAISINLSLTALAGVLNAVANKKGYVPYKDSKLTLLMKDCLTKKCNLMMLAHVSPNLRDLGETIATLDFCNRICKVSKHKIGKEKAYYKK